MKTPWLNSTLGLLAIALSSCTLFPPAAEAPQKEVLNQMPEDIPQRSPGAAVLLVLPPDTNSVYNTTQMAYMLRPYQIDYFAKHEWAAAPAQMLQPLLVQTLENTRAFSAVVSPPFGGSYSYALHTELVELVQDFAAEQPVLRLALRCQLSDGATGRVIATEQIVLHEPMQERAPYAGVAAANRATASALREVARLVVGKLPQAPAR